MIPGATPSAPLPPTPAVTPSPTTESVVTTIAVTPARRGEQSRSSRDDAQRRGDDAYEPRPRTREPAPSALDVNAFDQARSVARSIEYLREVMDPDPPDGFASSAERTAAENARRLATGGTPPPTGRNVDITA
jgi:hypothetical protein